jgi:hypothetical protein
VHLCIKRNKTYREQNKERTNRKPEHKVGNKKEKHGKLKPILVKTEGMT